MIRVLSYIYRGYCLSVHEDSAWTVRRNGHAATWHTNAPGNKDDRAFSRICLYGESEMNLLKEDRKMIARLALSIAVLWACHYSGLYAQDKEMAKPPEKEPTPSLDTREEQKSHNLIRVRSFYLKDGQFVKGRVISEDRHGITLEELKGSRLVVSTYGQKKIVSTKIYTTVIPEFEYFIQLAEYFSSRTGDFRDDPDDFIQAIRSYEKAKQLVSEGGAQNSEQANKLDHKIQKLQSDREVWVREVKSRAELRKLESEAMIDARLSELEKQISDNRRELLALAKRDGSDYKALKDSIVDMARNLIELAREHEELAEAIESNEDDIDRLWRRSNRGYVRPRIYRTPGRDGRAKPRHEQDNAQDQE